MKDTLWYAFRRVARGAILPVLVAVASAYCRSSEPGSGSATVARDSAGVRIVESARPRWTEGDQWVIDSVPVIDIGPAQGDSALVLLRVGGIAPLGDGRVAVVNGADRQVLVFSPTGQLERRIGRRGTGPGDLSRPTDVLRCGIDTLVVNDVSRLSMFHLDGSHVREWPLVPAVGDGAVRIAGVSPDCSEFSLFARPERLPPVGDIGTAPATLFWTRGPDQPRDTLGTFEARRVVRRTIPGGGDQGVSVPWTSETRWAVAGERTYVALATAAEVRVYDRRGQMHSIIRWRAPARPVNDGDRRHYDARRGAFMRIAPGLAGQLVPELDEFPGLPAAKPPHLGVLVDDSARIWLRDYPDWIAGRPDLFDRDLQLYNVDDDPTTGETWQLFDRDGQWLGAVRMPPRLTVRAIAGNRVYGVWRDADGVEHVRGYSIGVPPRAG